MLALLLAAQLAGCVPARWPWTDVASLTLLDGSPVNCLVLDSEPAGEFAAAAASRGLRLLRVDFTPRARLKPAPLMATGQGLWPGVRAEKQGQVEARPTSAAWVDTNTGYLRYLRATAPPGAEVWIGVKPPEREVLSGRRYAQAVADAAMSGARWVVSLDTAFAALLRQGEPRALEAWTRINGALRFYEGHRELVDAPDFSRLALLEDASSGALMSGGIVDMIAAKHIPLRVVPVPELKPERLGGVKTLLNIDPAGLTEAQKEELKAVARQGVSLVNGPPGWRLSLPDGGAFVFAEDQVKKLDEVWRGVNGFIWGKNFAVRVFGAHSVLSNLKQLPDGRFALHLVNYSDYPVEAIAIHAVFKVARATLLTPRGSQPAEIYPLEEGAGIDVAKLDDIGILVLEPAQEKR
ncbi:MAG: hypothetical protein HY858_04430 [Candidatus Solibacter usitatus]|nr:hypothetical protein [Candidatus Solibacter usitatus]